MVGEKTEAACSLGDTGGPRTGRHQPSLEKVASFASLREPQLSLELWLHPHLLGTTDLGILGKLKECKAVIKRNKL